MNQQNQILESRQDNLDQTQIENTSTLPRDNHLFEWSRILENISVVALQKFTSQSIGILSEKQIIIMNVQSFKIEKKIKLGKKTTCLTIINPQQKSSNSKISQFTKPIKKKKQGKCVQFFTGHFDGTITMQTMQNNKVKQMKVFSDIDPSDRQPVSCLNVMSYQSQLNQNRDILRRFAIQKQHTNRITPKTYSKTVLQYILLSGHQNGKVKQWNIFTGQCIKVIEIKHNGILFCMTSIQDSVLNGGQNNIEMHQITRANSLPSSSITQCSEYSTTSTTPNSHSFTQFSNRSIESRNRGNTYPNDSSFMGDKKAKEVFNNELPSLSKKYQQNSWSNSREEERQKHTKKHFKVIHQGYLGSIPKQSKVKNDQNSVRNMVVFDDKTLLSHGLGKDVIEWRLEQNKITKKTHTGHSDDVECIEKLNDSQFITGGKDSKVIVWDREANQNHIYEGAHSQPVSSLSSMGENSFISSGQDNKVLFWKQQPK